jgi:hypothetical protein
MFLLTRIKALQSADFLRVAQVGGERRMDRIPSLDQEALRIRHLDVH